MLGVARAYLRDDSAAEDAVQEGFLKALKTGVAFEDTPAMRRYLLCSVRSAAVDILRRGKNRQTSSPQTPIQTPSYHLHDLLSALPKEQKEVVILRIWGGMSFREIAETLGLPLGTVLSRMRYALLRLRKLVSE